MELFGLHDKYGNEYSLTVSHEDDSELRLPCASPIFIRDPEPDVVRKCRQMGIKAGVRVKFADRQSHFINNDKWTYNETDDALFIGDVLVYYKGKWAKIVPDKPKELPKTIDELMILMQHFESIIKKYHGLTSIDFLKEQGYKVD